MAMNLVPVPVTDYQGLLSKFPEKYRAKLAMYTGEELFYVYKLALFKPKRNKNGDYSGSDLLYLSLRDKFFRWLKGEACDCEKTRAVALEMGMTPKLCTHGINPMAWQKLGSRFKKQFYGFVIDCITLGEQA